MFEVFLASAIQFTNFQPKCETQLEYEKGMIKSDRPCPENCVVLNVTGRPTDELGYWGKFLGYDVCYKCWVPVGRS